LLKTKATITVPAARAIWRLAEFALTEWDYTPRWVGSAGFEFVAGTDDTSQNRQSEK
jgi:hypothetical protein